MKRHFIWVGIGIAALALACGGSSDETASTAPATETTASETAAKTPAAAKEAPAKPAAATPAPAAAAETPAVSAPSPDAVTQCLALATQQKWSEALDPCRQAAKERPTDLRIKNAVQQAEAAAAG